MNRELVLVLITLPVYLIFIITEIYEGKKRNIDNYGLKDSLISIWMGILGGVFDYSFKWLTLGVLDWCNKNAIYQPNLLNSLPILAWGFVFLGQDFCFYWLHRAEHYVRVLWASHSTHHSSEKYNFTVALRSSVFQPLYRYLFYIPVAFLGFDGLTVMFMYAVNQVYQFFLHTEMVGKLPKWYEAIFVTPSHHRVHHASDVKYLDKNMGQVLIIWDKMFGTFQNEEEKPNYGLTTNLGTFHPIKVVTSEWSKLIKDLKKNTNFVNKLKYIFFPPGWSHDGSTKTSNQLRKEM